MDGGGVLSKAAEAVVPSSKPRPTNGRRTTTLLTVAGKPNNLSADLLPHQCFRIKKP